MSKFNRLGTVHNKYQNLKQYQRILTVCSAGLLRSPTIANYLINNFSNVNVRSAGINNEFALIPVDEVLLEWADVIICAEEYHYNMIISLFDEQYWKDKKIFILEIEDIYEFNNNKLKEKIHSKISNLINKNKLDLKKIL